MKYKHLGFDPEIFGSLYDTRRTIQEKEMFLSFAICVAGKTLHTTAAALNKLFDGLHGRSPFDWLANAEIGGAKLLKDHGIGCFNQRMASVHSYIAWRQDHSLNDAGVDELMKIKGVSHKTARFFLLYNFAFQPYATIDVQLLKVLRANGYPDAPEQTPTSRATYNYWEKKYMELAIDDSCEELVEPGYYARRDFEGWEKRRKMSKKNTFAHIVTRVKARQSTESDTNTLEIGQIYTDAAIKDVAFAVLEMLSHEYDIVIPQS